MVFLKFFYQFHPTIPRYSTSWLNILDQWMTVSEMTREALVSVCPTVPDFLPSCLSLLSNQQALR